MDKTAGELTSVWVVRDPSDGVDVEMMSEIVFPIEVSRLVNLVIGTGAQTWKHENTKLYTDEASAKRDAETRLKKLDAEKAKKGLLRHVTHDGRILYMSVPPREASERVVARFLAGQRP